MILNARNNLWVLDFTSNYFYKEVRYRWDPIVKRLKLPYESIEDFINACVQSVSFPSVEVGNVEQQQSQFRIAYRPGKELEPILDKNLAITFKLSEGFISYWILFDQIEEFLKYQDSKPFWPNLNLSFLDNNGMEMMTFEFNKIIPLSLTQFQLSTAQTAADFNTFTLNIRYNRFKINRKINGVNVKVS